MKWGTGAAFVAMVLAQGLSGCLTHGERMRREGMQLTLAEFMRQLEPPGWTVFDDVREFVAENLYEQINGRAELYLAYDVRSMSHLAFEKAGSPGSFLDISVYDMGTATNAFGVFSVERSPEEPEIDLGRAAYTSDSNVYIWQGRHYVRIIAPDISDALSRTTLNLGRELAAFLPDSDEDVWGLDALPQENRVPGTVRYFRVDAMGLSFLRDTYTAEYRIDGMPVTVFLTQARSADAARVLAAQYFDYASKYGRNVTRMDNDAILCTMGDTYDVVFPEAHLFAGVTGVSDKDGAIRAGRILRERLDGES